MLLELVQELGIDPKRTSSCQAGEYHSPCPSCGGEDRFVIWPEKDRYWCRQCKKRGDGIQFCRDFMNLSYKEACCRAKSENRGSQISTQAFATTAKAWLDKAGEFVISAHRRLLVDEEAIELLKKRGLTTITIEQYSLGWNPVDSFPEREIWGLERKLVDGKVKKLFLPKGIVIPILKEGQVQRVKIRKIDWKEGDHFGKYYELPGGADTMGVFGDCNHEVVVLVEAELDAMLVAQETSNLCVGLALGGAQKRPNKEVESWLRTKQAILFVLDFDESGKREYTYWRSHYPNVYPWPVPKGKSPEEAFCKHGVDLKQWISTGLRQIVTII